MLNTKLFEEICDAAAQGKLVVVTGSGISSGLIKEDGQPLPNWAKLVEALRARADVTRLSPDRLELLERLLPSNGLSEKVHGDALIEASSILQGCFDGPAFQQTIAENCEEKKGETSDSHQSIAEIGPAGVITFNYDRGHENAFGKDNYQKVIYSDSVGLRSLLDRTPKEKPFLLKAHGCITSPESIVLSSDSYRKILTDNRTYRAFLQNTLARNTLLIVGFSMRDRDFDQLLTTMEIEFGAPINKHAFMQAVTHGTDEQKKLQMAEWATLEARFGIEVLELRCYSETANIIRSIADTPGPFVSQIVQNCVSPDLNTRQKAHLSIQNIGALGQRQVLNRILAELAQEKSLRDRSELIYAIGKISYFDSSLEKFFLNEIRERINSFNDSQDREETECIAHALLSVRNFKINNSHRFATELGAITGDLEKIDQWLVKNGSTPRLANYARAAASEVSERT